MEFVANLNKYIESTALKPTCTESDVKKLCSEAIEYDFYGVCVPPYYVEKARDFLAKTDIKVITVVGFPLGYTTIYTKIQECKRYLEMGVDEIDVVVNIAAIKSGDWDYVESEIEGITTVVSQKDRKIKIIVETAYLTDEELVKVVNICVSNKVHYIKTSTGYADRGASVGDIKRLKMLVGDTVRIKASGGIKNAAFVRELIEAGADKIGTSSGVEIMNTKR